MIELIKTKAFLWIGAGFVVVLAVAVVYTHFYTKSERDRYWEDKIQNSPTAVRDTSTPPPIIKPVFVKGKPFADPNLQRQLDSLRRALQNKDQIEEYLGTPFQADLPDTLQEQNLITVFPITKEIKRDVKYKPLPGKIFERTVLAEPPPFAVEFGVSHDLRFPLKLWYQDFSVGGLFATKQKPIFLATYKIVF